MQAREQPNFLIITLPGIDYESFASPDADSPRLQRLRQMAGVGLTITDFYATCPSFSGNQYALLAGQYPFRAEIEGELGADSKSAANPQTPNFVKLAADAGYTTALVGQWGLGYPNQTNSFNPAALPLAYGFASWYGTPFAFGAESTPPLVRAPAYRQGLAGPAPGYQTLDSNPTFDQIDELLTQHTIELLAAKTDKKFLIMLSYPQAPVGKTPPTSPDRQAAEPASEPLHDHSHNKRIESLDSAIGRLTDLISQKGIARDTLIVITSLQSSMERNPSRVQANLLRDGHGSTWEGGVRLPAIFYWPGKIKAEAELNSPVSLVDLSPTLLAVAAITPDPSMQADGISIFQALLDPATQKTSTQPKLLFLHDGQNHPSAVRYGNWKAHFRTHSPLGLKHPHPEPSQGSPLLFDLANDLGETENLATDNPAVLEEIKKALVPIIK